MKQETITLREELASKVRELQDAHGELSKIASNNERMKDAAQQYSERMIALRGTEVGKARMAAQQMYDERLRALRSEHEIAVLAQRDAHGDELKRFTSQAATEIESLRELLQKSTERVSDIQRDTVEIDQLKARCDEAMGNAEANAEQRWLSRYSDLQLKEAKLKEQLEAKGTELEAERERYKQLDVQATMRRGMVQSLKEQLEEGEAARTMSPSAAEYQQQRDELLQILRLQDDELRQLRLERQPQSTKPHEESEPSQAGSLDVVAESICNGSEMKYPLIAPLSRGGGLDRNDKAFVPAASPLPPSVVRQETRSQETLQPSLSTSQQIKTTDNTEPKSNPLRSDSNTAASQVAVPLINDHGKRRSSLFLLNDEDDTPVKKHFRVSESESSAPPSTQQHGADVPAHWVRDHFTRCVQKTADGRYICKICLYVDILCKCAR